MMNNFFSHFQQYGKQFLVILIAAALIVILTSFSKNISYIDEQQLNLNESTIISSYWIDKTNSSKVNFVLQNNNFTSAKLNEIPYELKNQSYWIKLSIDYPIKSPNVLSFKNKVILMAEHSMLEIFNVYKINSSNQAKLIYKKEKTSNNIQSVYPNTPLTVESITDNNYLIQVKNSGPPQIPLLILTPKSFEKRLALTQMVYGVCIGIILIMAIYNFVLFFAANDKVYLLYIGYLIASFIVLSILTGYVFFIFSNSTAQILNKYLIFFDHFLILFLFLFTLFFLKYDKSRGYKYFCALFFAFCITVSALYSLFLNEINQAILFFSLQIIFYFYSIYLILNRVKRDFSWAKFYFISWIVLLIGATIQPLVLTNKLQYTFFTGNAFMFALMIEVTFMAFALADRIRKSEQDKLSMIAYHQSNQLPRKTNLFHTIRLLTESNSHNFTVVVVKPEQFNRIVQYIDEQTHIAFFRALYKKLSSLFRFNDAIMKITEHDEKLCFLENNSLAFVINNQINKQEISVIVQSIQNAVSEVFTLDGLQLPLTALVGLAKYPEHGNNSELLINNAFMAASKARTLNSKWNYYTELSQQHKTSSMQLAIDLNQAFKAENFELYHQPQIDLKTGKVCSSECLLRWQHPELGMILPEVFIPIAEDFGLMPSLTLWVINKALLQQTQIKEATELNHMISINISGKDIVQEDFIGNVIEILSVSEITAEKIIFELTESISFSENKQAIVAIEKLIALGITISIDDFGTGYSSMAQVSNIPFQELKIDRQFVENISDDYKRRVIAETTTKMAKGLGLEVVAEGINSELDEETLRKFGCDIGQGYFYAKPMPVNEYIDWLSHLSNGQAPKSLEGDFIPAKN